MAHRQTIEIFFKSPFFAISPIAIFTIAPVAPTICLSAADGASLILLKCVEQFRGLVFRLLRYRLRWCLKHRALDL
jgi:hypothetical protein